MILNPSMYPDNVEFDCCYEYQRFCGATDMLFGLHLEEHEGKTLQHFGRVFVALMALKV